MNIEKIRYDFPILKNQPKLIYFDNACTTLRPQPVIDAINEYYTDYSACAGRSAHKLGEALTKKIDDARGAVAKFIGAKKDEIIFTRNTTEAINIVAQGFGLQSGDIVVGTDKEHNSNLIPWLRLAKEKKIKYHSVNSGQLINKINELKPRLVAIQSFSNLDGSELPLQEITEAAHKCGSLILVDGAQAVPRETVSVLNWCYKDVDFLAFSGHKMCGPSGTGVLYGKRKLLEKLNPLLLGGGTIEKSTYADYSLLPVPERFEAGLQNYGGILGLAAAVKYIKNIGMDNIARHEERLNQIVTEGLKDEEKIKIIGPENPLKRGGIFTFYIDGVSSHEIALTLDKAANIAVRSGRFCVHSWFEANKIKDAVRASFYFYNTEREAEIFVESLKKVISIYK